MRKVGTCRTVVVQLLYSCCTVVAHSLYSCCIVVIQLLCSCYTVRCEEVAHLPLRRAPRRGPRRPRSRRPLLPAPSALQRPEHPLLRRLIYPPHLPPTRPVSSGGNTAPGDASGARPMRMWRRQGPGAVRGPASQVTPAHDPSLARGGERTSGEGGTISCMRTSASMSDTSLTRATKRCPACTNSSSNPVGAGLPPPAKPPPLRAPAASPAPRLHGADENLRCPRVQAAGGNS